MKVTKQEDQTAMQFYLNVLSARLESAYQKILTRENTWSKEDTPTQSNEHPF